MYYSLLIVTYNSADVIAHCLRSALLVDRNRNIVETVIVDNASTDSTKEIIRSEFHQVVLVENSENIGFGAAVNEGFAYLRGDVVLLLNPDTVIERGFFTQLNEFVVQNPQASIIGCALVDVYGRRQRSSWKRPSLNTAALEMLLPHSISLRLVTVAPSHSGEVEMVSGACMVVRGAVFRQLKGFDRHFFMYYEDADFCFRARKAGWKVFFYPDARVIHRVSQSWSDNKEWFLKNFYRSKLLFFRKHYSSTYFQVAFFIVLTGLLMRISLYFISGIVTYDKDWLRLSRYHSRVLRAIFHDR